MGFIEYAVAIGSILEEPLHTIKFARSRQAKFSAMLMLTIAEKYIALIAVLKSPAQSHAGSLLRGMQEALVDMKCLKKNGYYSNSIIYEDACKNKAMIEGFLAVVDIGDDKELKKWNDNLAKEETVIADMKKNRVKKYKVFEKYKEAGMAGDYSSTYAFMCSDTHNNLMSLISRHEGPELRFMEQLPFETLKGIISHSIGIYAEALDIMPTFSDLERDKLEEVMAVANTLFAEFDAIAA